MKMIQRLSAGFLIFILSACAKEKTSSLTSIELPAGFKISVYAKNVPNARGMALGDKGTLFVGSMLISDDTGNAIYRITYQK